MKLASLVNFRKEWSWLRHNFPFSLPAFLGLLFAVFILAIFGEFAPALPFLVVLSAFFLLPLLTLVALIAWYHEGLKPAFDSGSNSEFALLASIVPALGILLVVLALPAIWTGTHIARLARVAVNHSSYQAIIAEARQSGDEQWYAEAHGITYNVDLGPPVRVAFHPSGFLDNWSAIVFDPTGDVMLADGFDSKTGEFAAPDRHEAIPRRSGELPPVVKRQLFVRLHLRG